MTNKQDNVLEDVSRVGNNMTVHTVFIYLFMSIFIIIIIIIIIIIMYECIPI